VQDDRKLTHDEVRAWVLKHLASFPDRDEEWRRSVLNIRTAGLARLRRAVASDDEAA
jgi:hypothetical protein